MPSRRTTLIRDRQRHCASRKKTHKEQEQHLQRVMATLNRLEDADKKAKASA